MESATPEEKVKEAERFLQRLAEGGTVVSSNECSVEEITHAQACRRFYVDARSYGYVYRPKVAENS